MSYEKYILLQKYILSQGGKELGLSFYDIKKYLLTPNEYKKFLDFMEGQTTVLISGIDICYTEDFERFIKGLSLID